MITLNRYLGNEDFPVRILACDYQGGPIFLLVAHQKEDPTAAAIQYKLFEESYAARRVKELMGIPRC